LEIAAATIENDNASFRRARSRRLARLLLLADGVYKGRKRSVDIDAVRSLKAEGIGPSAIAKRLGVARASVYRALAAV
jgi:DNA invertase Pin-like site-specific DNA recombinase